SGTVGRLVPANRLYGAARRGGTVDRPAERLEDGRLAGAVRPAEPGKAELEVDRRVRVLPEVEHPDREQSHRQTSAPAFSMYVSASETSTDVLMLGLDGLKRLRRKSRTSSSTV